MCCAVIIVNDDTSLTIINTSIQLMMSTSRAADTLNVRACSVPVRAVLVLKSRIGFNGFRITSTLNRELFLSDTSDLRTDELMILRMHDSANSVCLL